MLQIVELLMRINRQIMRLLAPAAKAQNLSMSEMQILWKVHSKNTCRMTDLARNVHIPPSTFTGIVDRLAARNYLKRLDDPDDRRGVLVQGTEELDELIGRIKSECDARLAEALKGIPEDFIRQFAADLQLFNQYLPQDAGSGHDGLHCPDTGGECWKPYNHKP